MNKIKKRSIGFLGLVLIMMGGILGGGIYYGIHYRSLVQQIVAPHPDIEQFQHAYNALRLIYQPNLLVLYFSRRDTSNPSLLTAILKIQGGYHQSYFQGTTPLHIAVVRGWIDDVKILLDWGANPNICDEDGRTPYDLAILFGEPSVLPLLDPKLARRLTEEERLFHYREEEAEKRLLSIQQEIK